jgi:5-methyltetrahydrofolate--homocysteine methyltransferase
MDSSPQAIFQTIVDGGYQTSAAQVHEALQRGSDASDILNQALIPAMAEVGRLFAEGEYFVPDMLVSARAMQNGLNVLKPALVKADVRPVGRVVAGTVQGDIHDIGKNLMCMMLEGAAFEITDLGTDVSPQRFVEAVQAERPQVVAMSAMLTTTMANMGATIEALEAAGLRGQVKVIVGGAPLSAEYARRIAADGYAADAYQAVVLARSLLGL